MEKDIAVVQTLPEYERAISTRGIGAMSEAVFRRTIGTLSRLPKRAASPPELRYDPGFRGPMTADVQAAKPSVAPWSQPPYSCNLSKSRSICKNGDCEVHGYVILFWPNVSAGKELAPSLVPLLYCPYAGNCARQL